MSNWIVVPSLLEGRDQLDERFPNRDKSSDGTIGDTAHQASTSSHNPDETGRPEFSDHDGVNEVRAADFDKDLRDSNVTMEQVVQLWITKLRAGEMWWIRYIIYNGRIWHRRDGFVTRTYTGSNKHTDHVHVNNDFTNAADLARNTNWHLSELGAPGEVPVSQPSGPRDLKLGDSGEDVRHLQEFFAANFPKYRVWVNVRHGRMIDTDGKFGPQTEAWVKTFQERTEIRKDGIVGPQTRAKLRGFGYKY